MKRLVILSCLAGVTGWLVAGCEKPPTPVSKKRPASSTNRVARVAAPKVNRIPIVKESRPGTVEVLDSKNGFRDVTFGQSDSAISDLVLKSSDDARQLKTCVRSKENLSLYGMPVDSIEYNFFAGQLYSVQVKWKREFPANAVDQPPTTDLSVACAREYGMPRSRRVNKDGTEFAWRGHKAEIVLTETLLPGVSDRMKGGWVLPPTTSGQMTVRNIALARAADTPPRSSDSL